MTYVTPSSVASPEIEKLRALSLSYDEIRRDVKAPLKIRAPQRIISPGCYVRIKAGAFADEKMSERALVKWTEDDRATLLLMIFNREVEIEFYQRDLELLNA